MQQRDDSTCREAQREKNCEQAREGSDGTDYLDRTSAATRFIAGKEREIYIFKARHRRNIGTKER